MYHDGGVNSFARCTEPPPRSQLLTFSQPPVRLYTVLRNPV
jgi:hypothetical protein